MATVRLFARLREIAGTSRLQLEGENVGEIVELATREYGEEFEAVVATSRIWRNGDEAALIDPVGPDDEIAILPPVSGGAAVTGSLAQYPALGSVAAAMVAVLAHFRADSPTWAAVVVGLAGLWVIDLASRLEERGRVFPVGAVLAAAVIGAIGPQSLGLRGTALAVALGVMVVLAWGIFSPSHRSIEAIAPGVLVATMVTAGVASAVLARAGASPDPEVLTVFLVAVIAATAAGSIVDRLGDLPYLDPYTVTALVAVLASVLVALLRDLDVAGYLLIGLGMAVALVAGRGLGGILRTGRVSLTDPAPGMLRGLDGVVLAAGLVLPLARLVL